MQTYVNVFFSIIFTEIVLQIKVIGIHVHQVIKIWRGLQLPLASILFNIHGFSLNMALM